MAGTEISSVIGDILDALQNGLNIFKSSGRKQKRRHAEPSKSDDDKHTHDLLTSKPREIKHVYEHSVAKHGRRFEVGDSTSQTGLAQILLVLNTGLIRLLNHALSNDHKSKPDTRKSVLYLSETATFDTLSVLSALNDRLMSVSRLDLRLQTALRDTKTDDKQKPRPRAQSSSQTAKRPPISPQLRHHGGWIRSKSDGSIVTVIPAGRRAEQKKTSASRSPSSTASKSSSTTNLLSGRSAEARSPPPSYSQLATVTASPPKPKPKPKPEHLQATSGHPKGEIYNVQAPQLARHPSMYIVPSDFFDTFRPLVNRYEPQTIGSTQAPPVRPPKVPLNSRPQQYHSQAQHLPSRTFEGRVRPPSMMTFMTASTKIGEIPEHRLPDRDLTEEQQAETPLPYVLPDMLAPPKKRGGRGLKFWKKDRSAEGTVSA